MADQTFDPDMYTKMLQLTKTYHRDIYPAIDPQQKAAGKVVLILGASRGLGKALAQLWASAGASTLILTARTLSALDSVTTSIHSTSPHTTVLPLACDVSSPTAMSALFSTLHSRFPTLNTVIANAGVVSQGSTFPRIGEMSPEDYWTDFEVNTRGTHLAAHYFVSLFGGKGTFVSVVSGTAAVTMGGLSSYSISKLACIRMIEHLAIEYPQLRAFALDPGIVRDVAAVEAFMPFAFDTVELIAAMSIWLDSSEAAWKLRGGYVHCTWDVEELEKHADEIEEKG
ncbi:oxidoreductase-like protein, partial [Polyplosphaeria fusca]